MDNTQVKHISQFIVGFFISVGIILSIFWLDLLDRLIKLFSSISASNTVDAMPWVFVVIFYVLVLIAFIIMRRKSVYLGFGFIMAIVSFLLFVGMAIIELIIYPPEE